MVSILKNKKISFFLFALALLIIISVLFYTFSDSVDREETYLISAQLDDNNLLLEIADDNREIYNGLSFREDLSGGHGMLFIFPDYARRQFVMRNMKFPIDIVFIKDGIVREIKDNCPPEGSDYKIIYESKDEINMVLELPAGYSTKNNIKSGSVLKFQRI